MFVSTIFYQDIFSAILFVFYNYNYTVFPLRILIPH